MKNWIKYLLTSIFLVIFVYGAVNLFFIWQDYRESEALYELAQETFLEEPQQDIEWEEEEQPSTQPTFSIQFEQLTKINPEVIGWIWMYDTVVNYPLVQNTKNNNVYLQKTYDGTRSNSGSIFMDYRNAGDFSNANTVIYGHNMKNGTMFSVLKKFGEQKFYDAHREFYIMTPAGNRRYEIIAAFQTDALSDMYHRNFNNQKEKEQWLNKVLRDSYILSPFTATAEDTFVTLSTCVSGNNQRARFVVIGRLAELEPVYQELP